MEIRPRYDGAAIIDIPGAAVAQLAPLVRQRRRLGDLLATLDQDQWHAQSRCAEWKVRDVVAHLADVNSFWQYSVHTGVAGTPSRLLQGFDPAATPLQMVSATSTQSNQEVLDRFAASTESFLAEMEGLADDDWTKLAETPPGHLPVGLLAAHALWDAWVHERDIAIPLGLPVVLEEDEMTTSLSYATALSPALAMGRGEAVAGRYALVASAPAIAFTIAVGDRVELTEGVDDDDMTPRLCGTAEDLLEALSLRAPLPDSAPAAWQICLGGLSTAFDAPSG